MSAEAWEVLQKDYLSASPDEKREAADALLQGAVDGQPPTAEQKDTVIRITNAFRNALVGVLTELPPSAERTLVIRHIEDAKMRAVQAVFRTVKR